MSSDSAIADLRNKIVRACAAYPGKNRSATLTLELDRLLCEYTDGIIDREAARWKETVERLRNEAIQVGD